ncbi:MAG: hypothetical protein A2231_10280 [Candidatus Firestonebacteria bacterium RIFOXYA2_FULL_40_8]|nr:MAG: hypothetical protein A2231_10280 [Candidatus Firestonebacteria bacterium RIFOXYA2_FULL_40_8]
MKKKALTCYKFSEYNGSLNSFVKNKALLKIFPSSWIKKGLLPGAAIWLISGCGNADKPVVKQAVVEDQDKFKAKKQQLEKFVAPVFVHGDGYGATGCIVISPPAYFTEEEAYDVISQELSKYGIAFTKNIEGDAKISSLIPGNRLTDVFGLTYSADVDGYDPSLGIGFVFVSRSDASEYTAFSISTVSGFSTKSLAKKISNGIFNRGKDKALLVYYDPMIMPEDRFNVDYEKFYDEAKIKYPATKDYEKAQEYVNTKVEEARASFKLGFKAKAKKELIEQVDDSVKWLEKRGILEKISKGK